MSWVPGWLENLGEYIYEGVNNTIDTTLDHVRNGTKIALRQADSAQKWMEENTWGIVNVPVNATIGAVEYLWEGEQMVATAIDDKLYENEKREVRRAENTFHDNEEKRNEAEADRIQTLNEKAEADAQDIFDQIYSEVQSQSQSQPQTTSNKTLNNNATVFSETQNSTSDVSDPSRYDLYQYQ